MNTSLEPVGRNTLASVAGKKRNRIRITIE
jgi:hypothetical protein